ncbi:hypothetical protein [Curtobacterium sp. Leaf261]|uniref:hypothetical protein n=1 Tax=Curtobacterium sp. Leaf261 TaxID=1736311 RepID=UPI0012E2FC2A|nr:hypothetical protein [Curtobacterium sp. Leaf261]
MTRTPRLLFATVTATAVVALTVGCSHGKNENRKMNASPIGNSAAKAQWFDLTTRIEATQQLVGGDWEVVDSNARPCNEGAVNWTITRIGPGVRTAEREELFDSVEVAWKKNGWEPVRRATGGDAPGLRLRYPASGVLGDGFYVELESTVHGTTIGAQTACAAGDVDQLNREQFAFNNTPGYTPTPAASPTALAPTPPAP